ncbi:hypothetical protein ASG89_09915 [Paenibacillus sp. Soil766]|uniref:extracellular solute-binding protein n=1 Tax=Paenibacillus sp. Soil766 TaxID=1736404 RepID=UPI00070ED49A|nr:extracellular solute-binding protein [Paenibacillus sp. Soil766]KRE86331.1 hypothetical protein ASG89_09915 [Paenibacillus sp. Soil766]
MQRKLSVVLSTILIGCVVVTGCSSKTESGQEKGTKAPSTTTAAGPVKINLFIGGSNYPGMADDFILSKLNKDLNMDLQFNVGATDYDQQLNVKIAGGSTPDIFSVSKVQLANYVKQGILLDLTPYMDKMPNIKAKLKDVDLNKGKVDGKQYAIAKRAYLPMSSYWVRQDWLDKLGLQSPKTLDELKAVAKAFTERDPDGNGKKDTYGITGIGIGTPDAVNTPSTFDPVFSAFGVASPGQFMIKDNKVVYSTTQPETKQALSYIKDMISEGLVDPEFMTNKGLKHQEKAFKGQAGILYINWGEMTKDDYIAQYKAVNPAANWVQMDALTGPGGKYQGYFDISATGGRFAVSKEVAKDPAKLNKILEYFNYIADGPGYLTTMYGIEGTHYKMENNIPVVTDSSKTGFAFNHQLTGRDEKNYLKAKFTKQLPFIDFAEKQPRIETYTELIPNPEGVSISDKNRFESEEITKFIFGKSPLDSFDAFTKTLETNYQLSKYVEQGNLVLKPLGYIK